MNGNWQKILGLLAVLLADGAGEARAADDSGRGIYVAGCHNETLRTAPGAHTEVCQAAVVGEEESDGILPKSKRNIQSPASKALQTQLRGKQLVWAGSGFFVATDGSFITNRQLVSDCALVSISPTFGEMTVGTIISSDETTDLALLRADLHSPGVPSFVGSEDVYRARLYIVGYPGPGLTTTGPTLAHVQFLRWQRTVFSVSTIAIQGELLLGNSGGALLDGGGGVIGAVLANLNTTQIYATTSASTQIVGLVLPSETLQAFLTANGIQYDVDRQRLAKPEDLLLADARSFMAQVGCWQ